MSALRIDYAIPVYKKVNTLVWLSLAICVIASIVSIATILDAGRISSKADIFADSGFLIWNASPFAGLAAIALLVRNRRVGSVTMLSATVVATVCMGLGVNDLNSSRSSTAALIFVVLPVIQWGIAAYGGFICVVVSAFQAKSKK